MSNQGGSVQFGYEPFGKKPAQFDLKNRELMQPDQKNNLNKPRTKGLKIIDWNNKINPKLNNKLLKLEPHEVSFSFAINPDNLKFVLGTSWYKLVFAFL